MDEKEKIDATFNKLLAENRGVFIGEDHNSALAEEFLISHFQKMKEQGVTTLYVEYSMYKAQAAQGGQECRETFMGPAKIYNTKSTGYQLVIEAALAAGLRVIGDDAFIGTGAQMDLIKSSPAQMFVIGTGDNGTTATGTQTNGIKSKPTEFDRLARGPNTIDYRDDFAQKVIEATYDRKKFIVLGGAGHSGNIQSHGSGKSLDQRLNIPSIYFFSQGRFAQGESNETLQEVIQAKTKEPDRIFFAPGKDGQATYKVTSWNEHVFAPPDNPANTPEGKAKLAALAKKIQDAGLCTMPAQLAGKDFLGEEDIVNLAKHMKKPAASPHGRKSHTPD